MKVHELDPIILSSNNKAKGIIENTESTSKKLIYQVPFSEVQHLTTLLQQLEQSFSSTTYIDVEINTLEDAYVNIAKEEENLLRDLQKYGMRRPSEIEKQDVGYDSFRAPDGSHEIQYQVKADIALDSIGGLSQIFQSLTNMRYQDKIITDFSVTRSSLEQVFI